MVANLLQEAVVVEVVGGRTNLDTSAIERATYYILNTIKSTNAEVRKPMNIILRKCDKNERMVVATNM